MSLENQTFVELQAQLSYWDYQMARYDGMNSQDNYDRAYLEFVKVECELIIRTMEDPARGRAVMVSH